MAIFDVHVLDQYSSLCSHSSTI